MLRAAGGGGDRPLPIRSSPRYAIDHFIEGGTTAGALACTALYMPLVVAVAEPGRVPLCARRGPAGNGHRATTSGRTALCKAPAAFVQLLRHHLRWLADGPHGERHRPAVGHDRLEPCGPDAGRACSPWASWSVLLCHELEAGSAGAVHHARSGRAVRVFPEAYPQIPARRAQNEQPHHRRVQRGHHGRHDHKDPRARGGQCRRVPGADGRHAHGQHAARLC